MITLAAIFPIKDLDDSVMVTVNSLASQVKINLVCIVVAERQVLDKLGVGYGNLRILAVESPARGVYNALNAGLDAAQSLPELDSVSFISTGAELSSTESLYDLASLVTSDSWAVGPWKQSFHTGPDRVFRPPMARGSNTGLSKLRHFSSYWPLNIEALVLGSKLAATVRFDESKKIGADFKLFATLLSQSATVIVSQKTHIVLPEPGLSSQQRLLGQRDVANARFEVSASVNGFARRSLLQAMSLALLMFESALNAAASLRVTKNFK